MILHISKKELMQCKGQLKLPLAETMELNIAQKKELNEIIATCLAAKQENGGNNAQFRRKRD